MTNTLYDEDIVAWAEQQAAALRTLSRQTSGSNAVDWPNLIEEVESLGRSQLYAVERNLTLILTHLIKLLSAPDAPSIRHWRSEILAFQAVARRQFSPSMRSKLDLDDIWRQAVKEAGAALDSHGERIVAGLPEHGPLMLDEIIERDFEPDAMLTRLANAIADNRAKPAN